MNGNFAAQAYSNTHSQTAVIDASPHRQIALLFGASLDRIHQAKGAIDKGDLALKSKCIGKSIDIFASLQGWLDMEQGGEISANLSALYDYMIRTLHEANVHNDIEKLTEVAALVAEVKTGWDAIAPEAAR